MSRRGAFPTTCKAEETNSVFPCILTEAFPKQLAGQTTPAASYGDALAINQQMQTHLLEMRSQLQELYKGMQDRYKANERLLSQNMRRTTDNVGVRGAYLKGGTFYFRGNMFFRDKRQRNCPHNDDYERRSQAGEIFPMDFNLSSRHVWSLVDKVSIVHAIKEQIVEYQQTDTALKNSVIKRKSTATRMHASKLNNLLNEVDEGFHIDWHQIAAYNLHYRHTASSCEAMWSVYLHPTLSRKPWTAEENAQLLEAAKVANYQDWSAIAGQMNRRSMYQCFVQYYTNVIYQQTDRCVKWQTSDDERLLKLIDRNTTNGVVNWNAIISYFPHKSKASIIQRYTEALNPNVYRGHFTPHEDLLLLAAVKQHGSRFSSLPRYLFPNRTIAQLRSHYNNTLRHRHKLATWSRADDGKLLEFIASSGTSAWTLCSQTLGNHSRTSCRTRFLTIQKFLQKNPECTLDDLPRKCPTLGQNSDVTLENWRDKVLAMRQKNEAREGNGNGNSNNNNSSGGSDSSHTNNNNQMALQHQPLQPRKQHKRQHEPPLRRKRCKEVYVERLRPVELKLYTFFKYAYKFQLNKNRRSPPANHVYRFCQRLEENEAFTTTATVFKRTIQPNNNDDSERCDLFDQLPPSWSTVVGFRALCIQAANKPITDGTNWEAAALRPDECEALHSFRQRLRVLFYKCAVLSRLDPSRVNLDRHRHRAGGGEKKIES